MPVPPHTPLVTESPRPEQFPLGVVVSGAAESGSVTVPWWVMPRVNFLRTGDDGVLASSTATDFGASGGLGVAMENGWSLGVSGDFLIVEDPLSNDSVTRFLLSAGVSYTLP